MTRSEFEDIECLSELIDFCYEVGCDLLDNIESDISDAIEEDLTEAVRHLSWHQIRDKLNNIDTDYLCYFIRSDDEWLTYYDAEEEFDYYKDIVNDWCEDNDVFEREEGEDDEEHGGDEDDEPAEPEPEIPSEVLDTTGLFEAIDTSVIDVSALMEKSRKAAEEAAELNSRLIRQAREAEAARIAAAEALDDATAKDLIGCLDELFV